MSKRLQLKNSIEVLDEIRDILNAMKNLSLMEIAKINKFILPQEKVVSSLENMILDFASFHQEMLIPFLIAEPKAYIVIGSERGFCGNFSDLVAQKWRENIKVEDFSNSISLLIGRKLISKINFDSNKLYKLDGLNAAEEIQTIILRLVTELKSIYQETKGEIHPGNWVIIYNSETNRGITPTTLKPFSGLLNKSAAKLGVPPLLNLQPNFFLSELLNQYLFAILFEVFSKSFILENRQRLKHMDAAIDWLDKHSDELKIHLNQLRQEEITEEIEVIMLSVAEIVMDNIN